MLFYNKLAFQSDVYTPYSSLYRMEESMFSIKKSFVILLCSLLLSLSLSNQIILASTSDFSLVLLSHDSKTLDIGDEFYLLAITSNGKIPTWKSSNSKVASVNTYGLITAKRAGSTKITAKIKNAEASCRVTVNKTKITISTTKVSMEHGEKYHLSATTSNDSAVTWKSSKKSIAVIDESGNIIGVKPGETLITASADGSSSTCHVTIKSPTISLSNTSLKLYRCKSYQISAKVSSNIKPIWKTNKKSVAIVDDTGTVTAIKNGSALITATVDGISKSCEIIVMKPDITLSQTELTLKKGERKLISAKVSSENIPIWTTSNPNIVTISNNGELNAISKGNAYIYATEDGTKVRCAVRVTE